MLPVILLVVCSAQVAVVGPGAIGAAFAACVVEAGRRDLIVCARRPVGELAVTRDGYDPVIIDAPVLTDPADVGGAVPWILLAVKAHQTEGARGWLDVLCGPGSVVVVLQNGVEHQQRVEPLVNGADVLPAIVWCPAEATAPGRVRVRTQPRLSVPAVPAGQALASLLGDGARVDLVADFTTEAWRKLCVNAVGGGLMALAGRRAGMFRDPDVARLARNLAAECLAVARAEGADLPDASADAIVAGLASMPADQGSSILADREARRPLEWEARNAVIRRIGARHAIPTPISDVIVPLLAAASDGEP